MPRSRRAGPVAMRTETRVGRFARIDVGRARRTGAPEVILGEGKQDGHLLAILAALQSEGRAAVVSRPTESQTLRLRTAARSGELHVSPLAGGRVWRLTGKPDVPPPAGTIGLVTAGTADVPIAEEARAVLSTAGVATVEAYDVGVAGLHRVTRAARRLEKRSPHAYLVFAGREGALPTVWAGLVRAPVVGV
ncbi:MAG: AIR carboxylase family protein, partial [Thermoplasmata archaeon]|nr:AIR carboxylase family protein [Thermoplasmata archaeon]